MIGISSIQPKQVILYCDNLLLYVTHSFIIGNKAHIWHNTLKSIGRHKRILLD